MDYRITHEACLVVLRTSGEYQSARDMRDAFRRITNQVMRLKPCYVMAYPRAVVTGRIPIDQRANILRSAHELLCDVPAIVYVLDRDAHMSRYFDVGFSKTFPNVRAYPSDHEALAWFAAHPHRADCPHSDRDVISLYHPG